MISVAIMINGHPITARSAVNKTEVNEEGKKNKEINEGRLDSFQKKNV